MLSNYVFLPNIVLLIILRNVGDGKNEPRGEWDSNLRSLNPLARWPAALTDSPKVDSPRGLSSALYITQT